MATDLRCLGWKIVFIADRLNNLATSRIGSALVDAAPDVHLPVQRGTFAANCALKSPRIIMQSFFDTNFSNEMRVTRVSDLLVLF